MEFRVPGIYCRLDCYLARLKERQECDHTYQTGDIPQIYPNTHYTSVRLLFVYIHTFIKRQQMERSLAHSHEERMHIKRANSCWFHVFLEQFTARVEQGSTSLHIFETWKSELGLQFALPTLLCSLHISCFIFLPFLYSPSPLKNRSIVYWAYFMSVLNINYFLIHNKLWLSLYLSNFSIVTSQRPFGCEQSKLPSVSNRELWSSSSSSYRKRKPALIDKLFRVSS